MMAHNVQVGESPVAQKIDIPKMEQLPPSESSTKTNAGVSSVVVDQDIMSLLDARLKAKGVTVSIASTLCKSVKPGRSGLPQLTM